MVFIPTQCYQKVSFRHCHLVLSSVLQNHQSVIKHGVPPGTCQTPHRFKVQTAVSWAITANTAAGGNKITGFP